MMGTAGSGGRLAWPQLQSWYAVPLRLIVGYGFMEHGYAKLVRGPENFIAILHALGVPAPALMAWATIAVERSAVWRFCLACSFHWQACRWPPCCWWRS
jgi:uncharacterized membrane protein YphA (DoxX/SURF4 family)